MSTHPSRHAIPPHIGLGTFRVKSSECSAAVTKAIELGYRSFDTAEVYGNEIEVGQAIRLSGLPRSEFFVTSKASPRRQGYEKMQAAIARSNKRLDLDFIDLYLIHWPGTQGRGAADPENADRRVGSWRAMQEAVRSGTVRHIGVSNFTIDHLVQLRDAPGVAMMPEVNQVECHPLYPQSKLRKWCSDHNIVVQGYSTLGSADGVDAVLGHATVQAVADELCCSPAQTVLAWSLQLGVPVVPKTTSEARMRENLESGSIKLSDEQMRALNAIAVEAEAEVKFCWDPEPIA